ncbi:MAG: 4Fe-4S binding protein [Bacteroidaceae bacterium]|nr:4Fe-4S binding protein [Bacteroidaceae bacterium]
MSDSSYRLPLVVLLLFLVPLVFALFFGRVFCAGVCPMGALQELVNVRNFRISRAVASALGFFPWIYLGFAILYAATRSQFIICRFDPFIGIFRLSGDVGMIVFGISLLVLSVFVGRPFCRFLCPYGALLGVVSSVALRRVEVTKKPCINCTLCHNSCPVDAIREPYANKGGERRMVGVRRVLLYFVMLPLLTIGGGWLLSCQSDTLSIAHRDVYLYTLLQSDLDAEEMPVEVEAFHEMGRKMEDLETSVADVRQAYHTWAWVAGALIGFVLGWKLIRLSVKRTRKTYEIEPSSCVACGKCFDYCPQNIGVKK